MRYKVPQNIDMEDRIVGPLTMMQFVTVMVGGMIVYVSYLLFTPTTFWFAAIPVGMVTLAFAFLKVNDQSFPKFTAAALLFLVRPKNRIWQKTDNADTLTIVHKPITQAARIGAESMTQKSQLESLSTVLDTGGTTPPPAELIPLEPIQTAKPITPVTPTVAPAVVPVAAPPTLNPPTTEPPTPGLHNSWGGN